MLHPSRNKGAQANITATSTRERQVKQKPVFLIDNNHVIILLGKFENNVYLHSCKDRPSKHTTLLQH